MRYVFWCGFLGFFYCYVGYPIILLLTSVFRRREGCQSQGEDHPSITVLLSVYNEEQRLLEKIENFLSLDYPREKLELWIGSDGSTDRTVELGSAVEEERVHFVAFQKRMGKTAVLNRLAERTTADVLVFTDVNARFREDALQKLVQPLRDGRVGLVSGRTVVVGSGGKVNGAYYRYEQWIRSMEDRLGGLIGADGAIYAMRRDLYETMDSVLINDLAHPCQVVLRGLQGRFAPNAICAEPAQSHATSEFQRQTRMAAQALFVYFRYIGPLLRQGHWRFSWMLTSHKLVRWTGMVWMLMLAAGTASLARENIWALVLFAAQAGFAILAASGAAFSALLRSQACSFPLYFCLVHLGYLRGFAEFVRGHRYTAWEPRGG